MRNMIVVTGLMMVVGMGSAFADGRDDRKDKVTYECKFEGPKACERCGDKKIECKVEGRLCDEVSLRDRDDCWKNEDPIEIKCSNGFSLFSKDASVNLDNNTLWLNADERKDSIATIRIEDFVRRGHDVLDGDDRDGRDFIRKADLLISKEKGDANRLEGVCKFEKKRDGHDLY